MPFASGTSKREIKPNCSKTKLPCWTSPGIRCGLCWRPAAKSSAARSEKHTSELQSLTNLVCRLLLEKKKRPDSQRRCRSQADHVGSQAGQGGPVSAHRGDVYRRHGAARPRDAAKGQRLRLRS